MLQSPESWKGRNKRWVDRKWLIRPIRLIKVINAPSLFPLKADFKAVIGTTEKHALIVTGEYRLDGAKEIELL